VPARGDETALPGARAVNPHHGWPTAPRRETRPRKAELVRREWCWGDEEGMQVWLGYEYAVDATRARGRPSLSRNGVGDSVEAGVDQTGGNAWG